MLRGYGCNVSAVVTKRLIHNISIPFIMYSLSHFCRACAAFRNEKFTLTYSNCVVVILYNGSFFDEG